MRRILYILVTALTSIIPLVAQASGTGVFRTAIVLKNGTQEIFPDTLVNRFNYTRSIVNDKEVYSLDIIQDGHVTMTIPIDSIQEINYREMTPYEQFAGDWYFVASPNGEPAPGTSIMVSTIVSIPYHAVLPAPGKPGYGHEIYCHIDSMAHRKGLKYSANFKLLYDYDESSQKGSVTMVLDDQHPISPMQYTEDPSTYAYWDANSTWYNGVSAHHAGGDTGGRHMYFLTHNVDTWDLEGHQLPCQWSLADLQDLDHEFRFPSIYEICWVVGLDIPFVYSESDLLGYIDIFASPRLMRHPWVKADTEQ